MRVMGAIASLSSAVPTVEPGGEAQIVVTVRNTGAVVDQFAIEVLGDAAAWSVVEPAVLSLFPGNEGTATVLLRPPRVASMLAGSVPFAVRVRSKEDPQGSVAEEGIIEVGHFDDLAAELVPRTTRGRRKAVVDLAIDNRGNLPLNATVQVIDPDAALRFEARPPAIVAGPGTATFSKVEIRPRSRFLRGSPRTFPFQVLVTSDGREPVVADGVMLQEQLVPKWVPKALLGAVVLLALFAVAWMALLRPSIKTAAKEAAAEEIQPVAASVEAAKEQAETAKQDAAAAKGDAADAKQAAGGAAGEDPAGEGGGGSGPPDEGVTSFGTTVDFRLAPGTPLTNGQTRSFTRPVEDGKLLTITDVIFQNPRADVGFVRVKRGSTVLYEEGLNNYRDLDYHFVSPMRFKGGEDVIFEIECRDPDNSCAPAVLMAGGEQDMPVAPPAP
jgi:hypothetical protein